MIFRAVGNTFESCNHLIRDEFLNPNGRASAVNTGHWQSVKGTPHSHTRELLHASVEARVHRTPGAWGAFMQPNLPWAEDHFKERVSGEPLNPGEQYKFWPWYKGGVENHKAPGKFSHTYMERFWPKRAGRADQLPNKSGIHFPYGDLHDLLELLNREPHTRQAYLPIWFPEDIHAAAIDKQRVPCTLGYHFMLREDQLHCFYPMRSVDFVRYLRDDMYMAGRLMQWIINELRADDPWDEVIPGKLTLFASSLHIFEGDVPKLTREHESYVSSIA